MSEGRPEKVLLLQLGDRTILVETAPLAKSRRTRLGIIIGQTDASRLRLKRPIPPAVRWLLAVLLIIVTTPIASALGYGLALIAEGGLSQTGTFGLFMVAFMGSLVAMSAFLLPAILLFGRIYVDFVGNRAHLRRLDERASWLKQAPIFAVQLVPGRVDEDLRSPGRSIQLNLILDDPTLPRVGFITFRDVDWTRDAARKLADYLGVPLIDQLPPALLGSE